MMDDRPTEVLVVGAGICGLTVAHGLAGRGVACRVVEASGRVGGAIVTQRDRGFQWEEGPNSFSPTPELLALAIAVGLGDELILADRRLPRYVWWQNRLQAVPMSPPGLLTTGLLSPWGKLRAAVGALGFVPPSFAADETVGSFFRRHLGAEVLTRLAAPFVSGVYAGDPEALSIGAAFPRVAALEAMGGGLVAGFRQALQQRGTPDPHLPQTKPGELGSFREGIEALPRAIAADLAQRGVALTLNRALTRLERTGDCWRAVLASGEELAARSVVLAVPAWAAAKILQPAPATVDLAAIPYPAVACVVLAYPDEDLRQPLRGFGHLVPRGQGIRTLGTIWASSLFPGRAPAGYTLLLNFIGGTTDPALGQLDEAAIVQVVHRDLQHILVKPTAAAPTVLAVNLWRRAIPQFTVGHRERLARIAAGLPPGLFLAGNYWGGVALGDCVRHGQAVATQVAAFLER
ncbi:MAG: protoporphyrinogen oxidase [Pseudanabaenaceae cyanobacterium]